MSYRYLCFSIPSYNLPGHYTSDYGSTDCSPCSPGSQVNNNRTGCDLCPAGTFATFNGTETCSKCADGTISSNTSCSACPDNSQVIENTCICISGINYFLPNFHLLSLEFYQSGVWPSMSCEPCPIGGYCAGGSTFATIESDYKYWRSSGDSLTFYLCNSASACPGGKPGTCGIGYTGVLCDSCENGYGKLLTSCSKCFNSYVVTVFFLFFTSLFALFLLCVYLWNQVRKVGENSLKFRNFQGK